ncbi:hypothetical protein TrST_g4627 [Triparma strigata]|uniref:Phytanoyl-CoA dioxygenase n=1 Tax=Triparma strigata TaxID=1606541 RepID=A0A9W7EXG2_9STRA|nr:hypothetical protein TrST_g4627 [Triparma strigata]
MDLFGSDSESDCDDSALLSLAPGTTPGGVPLPQAAPPTTPPTTPPATYLAVANYIIQRWSQHNRLPYTPHLSQPVDSSIKNVPLNEYCVTILKNDDPSSSSSSSSSSVLLKLLQGKGLKVVESTSSTDYVISIISSPATTSIDTSTLVLSETYPNLVPGGQLITVSPSCPITDSSSSFCSANTPSFATLTNPGFKVNTQSCKWLPSPTKVSKIEHSNILTATVYMSSYELNLRNLCSSNLLRASESLRVSGFCLIPNLFPPPLISHLSSAALSDFKTCRTLIKSFKNVDLLNPSDSDSSVISYKELSMREDLRVDIRNTPNLNILKTTEQYRQFRENSNVIEIVKNTMAGSVISLPGCADQCLHADTEHLYDFMCPTHYVNLFAVGGDFGEEVGQTAFVKGSQDLEVCGRMQEDRKMLEENVVRPFLGLGDAVLFDCRVLHFGTENRGEIRPVIYTNYWREFYRDPKNWDERESLFEGGEGEGEGSGES